MAYAILFAALALQLYCILFEPRWFCRLTEPKRMVKRSWLAY